MLGSKEPCLHPLIVKFQQQFFKHPAPQFPLGDDKMQRHDVCSLIIVGHGSIFPDKCLDVCLARLFQLCLIPRRVFTHHEMFCRPNHNAQVVDGRRVGYRAIVSGHKRYIPPHSQPIP